VPQLDRSGGVALYYQIEAFLRRRIEAGEFAPGEQLPTEDELMEYFGVSRVTVRRALADLSDQGLLVRRAGKGTFVIGPKVNQGLNVLISFTEQIRTIGKTPSSRLLILDIRSASSEVQKALDLPVGSEVILMKRLRLADGEPIALEWIYLPYPLCAPVMAQDWTTLSAVAFLEQHFGCPMGFSDFVLEAKSANSEEAEMLGLSRGAPVLFVVNTDFMSNGQRACYGRSTYRADQYRFSSRVRRVLPGRMDQAEDAVPPGFIRE